MKHSFLNPGYWHEFIPETWLALKKYNKKLFQKDLIAGVTVGIVALPLAMAFAIASGVSPEKGLITAIVAGFLISLLGGSKLQIGGPTGAFVVIIYSIIQRQGYEGLAVTTLIAGVLLLIAAFTRLGSWIKYIPYPLITGFTTGIAVIIFSSQVKDFLGLKIQNLPADFIPKWMTIFSHLHTFHLTTFLLALGTFILILLIRKFYPVLPWGITAVVISTAVTSLFNLPVETIFSRFGELDRSFAFPNFSSFSLNFSNIHMVMGDAVTIAFLAGIESLLSAIVADGMAGTRHRSNVELMGQGIANIFSIVFGGIPATGAIARTATNVKTGAKTPLAGMIHALTLLLIFLFLSPLVSQIPLAALSAVLVMIAWNMSEMGHFKHLFKAPAGDVGILLATFFLTVFVDLTVAVQVGVILAALIFMKRVSDVSKIQPSPVENSGASIPAISREHIPEGVEIYEVSGPFFFGIADTLKDTLTNIEFPPKVFILRLDKVPTIDATGLHALKEFYLKCKKEGTTLCLSEVNSTVIKALKKYGLVTLIGEKHIFSSLHEALHKSST